MNGYGGTYAVFSLAQLRPGNYTDTLIPRRVISLYGTYTSDRFEWGRVGATLGVTSVSSTSGVIPGAVRFPAYGLVNGSAYVERGPWRLSGNVDNLFDKFYFTPVADVYSNVAALPGVGRTFKVSLRRSF